MTQITKMFVATLVAALAFLGGAAYAAPSATRVVGCVSGWDGGMVRCFDQFGRVIAEDNPLWDCNTAGNGLCGKDDQTPYQP